MNEALANLRHRARADFRVGVYFAFAAMALGFVLPLAFVRFAQGAMLHGALNLAGVAFVVACTAYALRGGNLDRLGLVAATGSVAAGCAAAAVSSSGALWLFPIIVVTTVLVSPRLALTLCAATIVFLWVEGAAQAAGDPLALSTALASTGVFAALFAHHAGRRRALLEQMATIDPLTGAENRRALEVEIGIAIAGFRRDGRPVALALVDLDHFKRVNDRHGHDEGDRVLQHFVRLVQASVRRTDRLYRYGGEEFVLLMPATDELGLELAMSHLRSQIRDGLKVKGEPITVSIGGAVLAVGEDRDSWFARADDALYRAKDGGRNRLVIDEGAR
jgi:diguanylate cyclase (GGDEF)-like protein